MDSCGSSVDPPGQLFAIFAALATVGAAPVAHDQFGGVDEQEAEGQVLFEAELAEGLDAVEIGRVVAGAIGPAIARAVRVAIF